MLQGAVFFTPPSYIKRKRKRNKAFCSTEQDAGVTKTSTSTNWSMAPSCFWTLGEFRTAGRGCKKQVTTLFLELSMFHVSSPHLVVFCHHGFHMVTGGRFHPTVQSFHLPTETGTLNRAHTTAADGVCTSRSLIIEGKSVNSLNISFVFQYNFIFREVKCNHDFIV